MSSTTTPHPLRLSENARFDCTFVQFLLHDAAKLAHLRLGTQTHVVNVIGVEWATDRHYGFAPFPKHKCFTLFFFVQPRMATQMKILCVANPHLRHLPTIFHNPHSHLCRSTAILTVPLRLLVPCMTCPQATRTTIVVCTAGIRTAQHLRLLHAKLFALHSSTSLSPLAYDYNTTNAPHHQAL